MTEKQLKKICTACVEYIKSGKADDNQWLHAKKDILNKWHAGKILSAGQIEMIVKMYNMEVHREPVVDIFKAPSPKKCKPKKPKPIHQDYKDLPF